MTELIEKILEKVKKDIKLKNPLPALFIINLFDKISETYQIIELPIIMDNKEKVAYVIYNTFRTILKADIIIHEFLFISEAYVSKYSENDYSKEEIDELIEIGQFGSRDIFHQEMLIIVSEKENTSNTYSYLINEDRTKDLVYDESSNISESYDKTKQYGTLQFLLNKAIQSIKDE